MPLQDHTTLARLSFSISSPGAILCFEHWMPHDQSLHYGWLSQIAMSCGRLVLSSQESLEETGSDNNPVHHRWIQNRMPVGDKALQTQREASFIKKRLKYGSYCTNRQVIGEQLQFTLWYPLQLCFNSIFMGSEGKGTAGNQMYLFMRFF